MLFFIESFFTFVHLHHNTGIVISGSCYFIIIIIIIIIIIVVVIIITTTSNTFILIHERGFTVSLEDVHQPYTDFGNGECRSRIGLFTPFKNKFH